MKTGREVGTTVSPAGYRVLNLYRVLLVTCFSFPLLSFFGPGFNDNDGVYSDESKLLDKNRGCDSAISIMVLRSLGRCESDDQGRDGNMAMDDRNLF